MMKCSDGRGMPFDIAPIKIGDWVLLRWKKTDKTKFALIADGPFQVLKVGTNNVKLKFPKNSDAHPIVNISRVQLYFGPQLELITEPSKMILSINILSIELWVTKLLMEWTIITSIGKDILLKMTLGNQFTKETLKMWEDSIKTRQTI